MKIREATPDDWPAIWPFFEQIVTAGETYAYDPDVSEPEARQLWVVETNERAVGLWRSLGFEVLATVPEAFHHPTRGYVGLLVMHRFV